MSAAEARKPSLVFVGLNVNLTSATVYVLVPPKTFGFVSTLVSVLYWRPE